MQPAEKSLYYQYCLDHFMKWFSEEYGVESPNDISTLKSLKLLFFLTAADTDPIRSNTVLDNIFDKFSALPYGHVEIDVYSVLQNTKGKLEYFEIDNVCCKRYDNISINELKKQLPESNRDMIDRAFSSLKRHNSKLIRLSAFDLVNLSHQWYSWRYTFSQARKNSLNSKEIPIESIKRELKLFRL